MKKTSYILLLLSVFLLVLSTCRKKPELKIYTLELSEETVTISPNSATITNKYSYPGEVLTVKLLLSNFSDMSGSTEHETTVSNTTISVTLENLNDNTTYYYRYRYSNGIALVDTEIERFTTKGQVPTVTTIPLTSITSTTAVSGGSISDNGGSDITGKGVCWSIEQHPTINDAHTSNGVGDSTYVSNLSELLPNTQYYVRAYATNSEGTGYGNELSFTTSASLASVSTKPVTEITETYAKCGGNVTNNGGMDITSKGVCWGTQHNPTINDSHTENGTGLGEFDSEITGLNANVKYYVRAYATTDYGTAYGEEKEFTTIMGMPTVTTASITSITGSSAICGGNVINDGGGTITNRGVCWSVVQNPTTNDNHTSDGTGIGEFTSSITGLDNNITYYVRAYAINSNGTAYGEERSFTTQEGLAVISTRDVTSITDNSAVSGGEITDDGGFSITSRGACWSTAQNPTVSDFHSTDGSGTGTFTSNLNNLTYNTTYYVRAYATNGAGTSYGEEKTFTTNKLAPTVTTDEVSSITANSAVCGGEVTSDGGANVTERGVCYSTSQHPTINNQHTSDGNGTGTFTSSLIGLEENTTYYVRAYATNSEGTSYGAQKAFTTTHEIVVPIVTTNNVTNITTTSATSGGNVTSAGYGTVSSRGVCWSTSQNPTINNPHTSDGVGTGTYTSEITLLNENTTYYIRAYATNEAGTAYGEQLSFTTEQGITLPTVITTSITNISASTAVTGGYVVSDGNSTVTERGVCWSTNQNPSINDSHTSDGTGNGAFTSNIVGLNVSTTYYVRAYATNSAGTAYGEMLNFTTTDGHGYLGEHEYVDLGLPSGLKWSTVIYTDENASYNYCWFGPYFTINWGNTWRTPTYDDMDELVQHCTSVWTEQDGVSGRLFTGPNGSSVFFPARGGYLYGGNGWQWFNINEGYYWTTTTHNKKEQQWDYVYCLHFSETTCSVGQQNNSYSFTIMPVCTTE